MTAPAEDPRLLAAMDGAPDPVEPPADDDSPTSPRTTSRKAGAGRSGESKSVAGRTRPHLANVSHDAPPVGGRHALNGRTYFQRETGLFAVNKEQEEYQIAPGTMEVTGKTELRDVDRERAPGKIVETLFHTRYTPPGAEPREVEVTDRDMRAREPQWPHALGIGGLIGARGPQAVGEAVRAMGFTVQMRGELRQAYAVQGPLRRPSGEWVYTRYGAPALTRDGVDDTVYAMLHPDIAEAEAFRVLGIGEPSTDETYADDVAVMLLFLSLHDDPAIGWVHLAQLGYGPWAGLSGLRHLATAIVGTTGSRKSAVSGLINAAQSRGFMPTRARAHIPTVKMRHAASSKVGAERTLYHYGSGTATVDDLFPGNQTASEVRADWITASAIADKMADQSGGQKGRREGNGLNPGLYPRCCLHFTMEELPYVDQHGSEAARLLIVWMDGPVNIDILSFLQEPQNVTAIRRAYARMIRDVLADIDMPIRAHARALDTMDRWPRVGHNRAWDNGAAMLTGALLFTDAVERSEFGPTGHLVAQAEATVREILARQASRCGMVGDRQAARDYVTLFVKGVRKLLKAGSMHLSGPMRDATGAAIPPHVPDYHSDDFGWIATPIRPSDDSTEAGSLWRASGKAFGAIHRRVEGATGRVQNDFPTGSWRVRVAEWPELCELIAGTTDWPMPHASELRRILAKDGLLHSEKAWVAAIWDGRREKTLSLDLHRIMAWTDDDDDAPNNSGGRDQDGDDSGGGDDTPTPDPALAELASAEQHEMSYPSALPWDALGLTPEQAAMAANGEVSTGPCLGCGEPMAPHVPGDGVYVNETGDYVQMHPSCDAPVPATATQAELPGEVPAQAAPMPEPHEAGSGIGAAKPDDAGWTAPELTPAALESIRRTLAEREWDGPTDNAFIAAVAARITSAFPSKGLPGSGGNGLVWDGAGRGLTGYRLFRMVQGRAPRRLPPDERIGDVSHPVPTPRATWHRPLTPDERAAQFLVRYDVNGQYLAAAGAIPLGTGRPVHLTERITISPKAPAYYRLTVAPEATDSAPFVAHGDGWYSAPAARYLADRGFVLSVDEGWVWTDGHPWLDRWYRVTRDARTHLITGATDVDRAALAAVKALYATFLGGWLASEQYNTTPLFRPDWRAHVRDRAAANQARALDKVRVESGRTPFALYKDAAYFTSESPDEIPGGLVVSDQIGKWKLEAFGEMTTGVIESLDTGTGDVFGILRKAVAR